jgi:hypothetical protein
VIEADQLQASVRPSGHILRNGLLVLVSAILVGAGLFGAIRYVDGSCSLLNRTPCTRILFVGNSYTYVNDLPTVFRNLARAAGQNVATGEVANGGETLAQHLSSGDAPSAIDGSGWQFVVLQEQSEIPAVEALRQAEFYPATRSLVSTIRATGATPVLLETWAHRAGWSDYGLDEPAMQTALNQAYGTIGSQLGVVVAPAGQAWQVALKLDPSVVLWQDDGSHPTLSGTYLAACVLYTRVFGRSPVGINDSEGLPAALVLTLQQAALQP